MKVLRQNFLPILISVFALAIACTPATVNAQDAPPAASDPQYTSTARVVRLSDVEGDAQFQRPGEDWLLAEYNLPLGQGFKLRTQDGRAEVQFEGGAVLRLAQNTTLEFTQLAYINGNRATQITLETGTAMFTTSLSREDTFEVITPALKVAVPHRGGGRFRIDVTEDASWVTVLLGEVQIDAGTSSTRVGSGHMLQLNASNPDEFNVDASPAPDDFDKWAVDRDHELAQGYAAEAPYLNAYQPELYSYGVQDLSSYGHWVACSFVGGMCWQPYGVPARWTPFSDGCWQFFSGFGWTWISAERWGWLPYHFGRWVFEPRIGWAWTPGQLNHFHPGEVRWLNVENKIAWTPAGAPAGTGAVIVGSQERGVIRTHERFDGKSEVAFNAVVAAAPPVHAATPRALRVTSAPGIVFDNSTHTFVNADPRPDARAVNSPNAPENRREQWQVQNLSRTPAPISNTTAPARAAVPRPPENAGRQIPVEPGYMRARPAPPAVVNAPQAPMPTHQVPTAPMHFATPPQQHFAPPVAAPQHFSPPPAAVPHVSAPPAPVVHSAPAPSPAPASHAGMGAPHH
ncbi:MAG TPA: DUF6600 domain-containing protein [Candidatus Acidoferrales bacterium]|nr:DUF6600 domain-containing protein [Candidatus Acidoferrales bacterium]